jgi:hypothetical protein
MGAPASKTNGMSIASMVLGIVSNLCCWAFFLPAVLALIFGFVSINQIKRNPAQKGRGMAIAGIALGGVSILLGVIVWVFGDTSFNFGDNQFGN